MLGHTLVVLMLVGALAACEAETRPRDDPRPAELLEVADRSEEIDFADMDGADAFQPIATSHRFFKDQDGYNLGVNVGFDDPRREPSLILHIDDTQQGAASQYQELRDALAERIVLSNSESEFCAVEGPLIECVTLDEKVVVAARARSGPDFVQRLLEVGRDYGRSLTAEG